ncbi:tetratricopeptide repeat protein [Streptomyces bicolor]|uniref:tetratricopeptide repeat protein n=1 Tax=Streptomyces bicolor TaxID=66874 RepID=UPI001F37D500|nr:tetratricopeptide repeat protein [Streptomyces bicolor]
MVKGSVYQYAAAPTALDALPARVIGFTGRGDELTRLLDAFDPAAADRSSRAMPVLVAALSGLGGVGKTALAVEAAHLACAKGWFPGGVLFLDLHGYDDDPVTGEQALETLLRALGAEPERIPVRADERGALYRSLLAERGRERGPVLVLADNASSPDQVRPLLPGDVRHRLLVTSRNKLPQLGARLLALDELTPGEAYELLDRALRIADPADSRVTGEPAAAKEVAAHCGHLPLALQISAALLVLDRDKPVAELAAELSEFRDRLDHLDDGERSVRAAFDLSYRRLLPEQARLLRLLALAPGPEVGEDVVSILAGAGALPARGLQALNRAHLVERGSGRHRWRLHDLVRAYGVGVVAADPRLTEEGEAARDRLLWYYAEEALAAQSRLRWLPGLAEPEGFATRAEALDWLDSEWAGLLGAVQWAAEEPFVVKAGALASCLSTYLQERRLFDDWIAVARIGLEGARRGGNLYIEACAWTDFGSALWNVGRVAEAIEAFENARDLSQAAGNSSYEAVTWTNLGVALYAEGRVAEAVDAQTRACELFRDTGDAGDPGNAQLEAQAWDNLGVALNAAGRLREAIDAHASARDRYEGIGDRRGEGVAWNNIAGTLWKARRREEAIEAYDMALDILWEAEDWYRAGLILTNFARVMESAGESELARFLWLQAADVYTWAHADDRAAQARRAAGLLTP